MAPKHHKPSPTIELVALETHFQELHGVSEEPGRIPEIAVWVEPTYTILGLDASSSTPTPTSSTTRFYKGLADPTIADAYWATITPTRATPTPAVLPRDETAAAATTWAAAASSAVVNGTNTTVASSTADCDCAKSGETTLLDWSSQNPSLLAMLISLLVAWGSGFVVGKCSKGRKGRKAGEADEEKGIDAVEGVKEGNHNRGGKDGNVAEHGDDGLSGK